MVKPKMMPLEFKFDVVNGYLRVTCKRTDVDTFLSDFTVVESFQVLSKYRGNGLLFILNMAVYAQNMVMRNANRDRD